MAGDFGASRWNGLTADVLNSNLVAKDQKQSLKHCCDALAKAGQTYDSIRIKLDFRSSDEHLLPLSEGLQLLGKLAEL